MNTQTLNTPLNSVAIIEKSVIIFKDAGKILTANQARADKAMAVGRKILMDIEANGMDPELDARCNRYLANINTAKSEMNDSRSPVTQIMDALRKLYTEVENNLDIKKPDTIPAIIHVKRNEYARQVFEEQERHRLDAERRTQIEKQKVDLAAYIKTTISNKLISFLGNKKLTINSSFNAITLDVFEEKEERLKRMNVAFPKEKCASIIVHEYPDYSLLSINDEESVSKNVHKEFDFRSFYNQYEKEVGELKQQLIDRLPSKKSELEEIAEQKRLQEENEKKLRDAKNEKQRIAALKQQEELQKEQKRLQEEAEQRKADEDARIKKEAEDSKLKAEQQTESERLAGNTMAMFDQAALVDDTPAPEIRQGFDIIVTHQAGFVEIFQFWFSNEGAKCTIDELGKKSLNQMKKYCEDMAHKHDSRIVSKYLKYEPRYITVNRKAK